MTNQIGVQLPQKTIEHLLNNGATLAISEGACGGLLSAAFVAHEGASRFFDGSRLIYSLKSRLRLSGWDKSQIDQYTGPSEQSAGKLARTLKMEFGSAWVLCETGYAGPHDSKTGDAFFVVIDPSGVTHARTLETGCRNRMENMHLFAQGAIDFLTEIIDNFYTTTTSPPSEV